MHVRKIIAITAVVFCANAIFAEDKTANIKVGETVIFEMSGDLAKAYAHCYGAMANVSDKQTIQVSTTATVAERFDGGQFQIEISSPVTRQGSPPRLVTLTAIVDAKDFVTVHTPKNTPVYASPAEYVPKNGAVPRVGQADSDSLHVQLSNLKGVKLRVWTLNEEIGE
ncbi:MAG TPA: hypothetical protein VGJ04_11650 [Pirellulales bacterium]|jgi:hypothetical protein